MISFLKYASVLIITYFIIKWTQPEQLNIRVIFTSVLVVMGFVCIDSIPTAINRRIRINRTAQTPTCKQAPPVSNEPFNLESYPTWFMSQ